MFASGPGWHLPESTCARMVSSPAGLRPWLEVPGVTRGGSSRPRKGRSGTFRARELVREPEGG